MWKDEKSCYKMNEISWSGDAQEEIFGETVI
jgi:hypothetical protein